MSSTNHDLAARCHTCGELLPPRVSLCPECQQFTPKGRRVVAWVVGLTVLFISLATVLMVCISIGGRPR